VRSETDDRHRATSQPPNAPTAASTTSPKPAPMNHGTATPRLEMIARPPTCQASWIVGKTPSTTTSRPATTNRASGTLRTASTKTVASLLTIQFRDSRAMPTSVPRMLAATMPATEMRSVLRRPSQSA
jgi:hypothetical protein